MLFSPAAQARDVEVQSDWVTLGDVLPVSGEAAKRPIAAAPGIGGSLPLSADFINAQASAAGIDLPINETVTVFRVNANAERPINETASTAPEAGQIPVLSGRVSRGDIIDAGMIAWTESDPRRRINGLITDAADIIGLEATRTLAADRPLRMSDVKTPSLVRKGDPVKLVYQTGFVRLTVTGKALSDGARGQAVRVMNLQSNRPMDAIVWAEGEARIQQKGL